MEYHFRQVLQLRKFTPIFPDPENLWIGGSKISVAELLLSVAAATNSLVPIVCPLREQPSVSLVREVAEGNCGYVLKREWSGSAHHVYAPTTDVEGALANFKERIQFEKEILAEMSPISPFWTPRWFKQPFIRDLVHRGELRSYVANGFLIGNCFTVPRDGSISDLDAWFSGRVRPLSRLEYVILFNRRFVSDSQRLLIVPRNLRSSCMHTGLIQFNGKLKTPLDMRVLSSRHCQNMSWRRSFAIWVIFPL